MPADRHDLPALERLTADVATAMRAAEQREAAGRRRAWWRRASGPLVALLLALLLAASAVALHATAGKGAERGLPGARCDAAHVVTVAIAATTAVGGVRCLRCAPVLAPAAPSRRGGSRTATPSLRPCA